MKTYDLIFSNQLKYRLPRHLLFWFAWGIFFEFTYFMPVYWYPGWNTLKVPDPVLERGYFGFYLLVIANTLLAVTLHVFFTYMLIYLLMPRYLVKEKYFAFALSVTTLLFSSVAIFYFDFKYGNPFIREIFGRAPKAWTYKELLSCAWDMVLFNCPAVGGAALGIKLIKRWWLKQKEARQLTSAKVSAELQLLKAQVHPHFLFNTLNNIYSFTLNASPKAPEMVKKLSRLLHYIINECNQQAVPLEKELKMIQDYMGLEKVRYGEQMDMQIDIRGDYSEKMIAPLLLIPFVENSFKHGTSKMLSRPWVKLNIIVEEDTFYLMLNNSKPEEYMSPAHNGGIGLANVKKRLQLLYTDRHELKMTEEPEHFTVLLEINLQPLKEKTKKARKKAHHEMV
jgi:sensor histidine kinase YesM